MTKAVTIEAVHTHTHTHTSKFSKNKISPKGFMYDGIKDRLFML